MNKLKLVFVCWSFVMASFLPFFVKADCEGYIIDDHGTVLVYSAKNPDGSCAGCSFTCPIIVG